jgi:hypothetical protein
MSPLLIHGTISSLHLYPIINAPEDEKRALDMVHKGRAKWLRGNAKVTPQKEMYEERSNTS